MTIQIPSELASVLSELGFDWPDADEDKLNAMGETWNTFAGTLRGLIAEAEKHAQVVWQGNTGAAVEAFQRSWSGAEAPLANLRDAADAAAVIAAGLGVAAKIVVALKLKVIAEVASFARVCYVAAMAAKTPWTAIGAIAVVLAARYITTQAIEAAFNYAIEQLLNG
jgi:hypothetical protein